jgi:hypothetical protein
MPEISCRYFTFVTHRNGCYGDIKIVDYLASVLEVRLYLTVFLDASDCHGKTVGLKAATNFKSPLQPECRLCG